MYGIVSQVSPKVNSRVRKCLRDSIEQIPDYVDLPKSSSAKRIPKSVLARIRRTITNRIFELVREHKLELRTLDSGKIDLALPRGMWSHVFPAVLERLQSDPFEDGSIADLVIKRCYTYRTTHDVLRSCWQRWPARHSMSLEEWSSSASLRPWVLDDITNENINGMKLSRQESVTNIASHDTNRGHYVESSEALGTRATKNDTDPSISAWLIASIARRTSDSGQIQHKATLARCHTTKGHIATKPYTFKLYVSDTKACQKKVHRPGSYGTNEPLKTAQDLSWGDEKERLTDAVPKRVHEQTRDHSVQSENTSTYCGLCFHMGQECDGARPCSQCVRKSTSCREQGRPLASGQDPKTKCHACFEKGQRCCGGRPCGFCIKHHMRCRDQGEPLTVPQDPQTKCHACFKNGSRCDGGRPCGYCVKYRCQCRDQGKERGPPAKRRPSTNPRPSSFQDPQTKCRGCFLQQYKCDRGRPCGSCIKYKSVCRDRGQEPRSPRKRTR
jgi:hypothetical protein